MSTIDLFSKRDQPAIDRPLIAYAFLAQASQTSGDLLTGLAPIFKPLAKGKLGQRFEPREFAKLVGEFYGIEIHPWAVDDLAPRLEKAGLLVECHPTTTTREYLYADVQGDFNQVTEADIRLVVKRFVDFARPILERHKLPVEERALEEAFFAQLTAMDFHAILLKPDNTKEDQRGASTLRLPKKSDRIEWENNVSAQSKINVLCAAFIVEASQNDEKLYDLLVQIASGALIAEVVLNVQDPGKTVSLDSLKVIVDGPLLMSLLDLSGEDSHEYARRLCEKLREKGATLQVFRHSTDEIRDNLEAVTNRVLNGAGIGATARRLGQNAFRSYATVILHDVASAAARDGIKVIDPLKSATAYQYCSEADESVFRQALGHFYNAVAQTRDAASIAGVIRLRHGIRAKMSQFHQSQYIFVTENPWIAECAGRFVRSRKLNEANEVPPAVTDRYLAGLLWILFGGKAAELTHYRLLANCSVALEPRGDVISRMHRFLSGLDENKAKHFRALMTVERASQHLMQLTLGDSVLISGADDDEDILHRIEEVLGKRYRMESDQKIAQLTTAHREEIELLLKQKEETAEQVRNTMAEVLTMKDQATALHESSKKFRNELDAERLERLGSQRILVERSGLFASAIAAKRQRIIAVVVGIVTAALAFLGTSATSIATELGIVAAIGAGFLAFVGFWNTPERLFGKYLAGVREKAFSSKIAEYGLSDVAHRFEVNWPSGKALLKPRADEIEKSS